MRIGASLSLGLVGILLPVAAWAQSSGPALSAEQIAGMLNPAAASGMSYSAEDLAAILTPRAQGATRSLKAGGGEPAQKPGTASSGVVPDLRINFAVSSANIAPGAKSQLDELGRAMQFEQLQDMKFVIGGHTDAAGSAALNQALSQRRAEAVVGYLIASYSISPDRLEAKGFGENDLLDQARPNSRVNRRVEVRAKE